MRAYLLDLDFKALREQKLVLINVMNSSLEDTSELEGILSLIDGIQDQAVEIGVDEKEVFG